MKNWVKALLCVSLSLMCLFSCVGYAKITRSLYVFGDASLEPPEKIYITDVSGGNYVDPTTLGFADTVITSDVTMLKNSSGVYEANYSFTVFNNTDSIYYYGGKIHGTYTDENGTVVAYSNPNIELTVDIEIGDEIAERSKRIINVKATFQKGGDTSDPHLFSIIEYFFSTTKPESSDDAAVSGVLGKFADVLNDSESYTALIDAMDSGVGGIFTGGRLNNSYIGNVVGDKTGDDSQALNALFGNNMELNIDGENTPVTIIIKRENVDGNNNTGDDDGNEMTLYITADPLNSSGKYVPVYAVVYTKNGDGEWYQIGEVYKGTASVRQYGGLLDRGTGSFNTDTWRRVDDNGDRVNNDTIENIIGRLS